MSTAPPKVFISATSGDLRTLRQVVKEALLTINCMPVEQTNFEPDSRTVEGMLRGKVAECQALIHIAGMRYGAEPDPATLPPGTPRRSYTQMEYHIGCELNKERGDDGFRVYTFVCPEDFPYYDTGADPDSEEKAALQRAHRAALMDSLHLFEQVNDKTQLQTRIHSLQETVLSLRREQNEVRREVHRSRKLILLLVVLLVVLGVGGYAGYKFLHHDLATVIETQKVDTPRIRAHLAETSEARLKADLDAAEKLSKSDDRESARAAAQAAHQARLGRIDDLAQSFALLQGQPQASNELKEMTRILQEEGADKALSYIQRHRDDMLGKARESAKAYHEAQRARLQPLLQAAGLQASGGQVDDARKIYQDLVALEPQWPEALRSYAWFLHDQADDNTTNGSLAKAVNDAQSSLAMAQSFHDLDPTKPSAQRLLSAAHDQMGEVLKMRGAPGDADARFQHCEASLTLAEALYAAQPDYPNAARDVAVSLESMGNLLATRGQRGDCERALSCYERILEISEKLRTANPKSSVAERDVWASMTKLSEFLTNRGQPGDTERALDLTERSLALREQSLERNPDNEEASRDVSVSLRALARLLEKRGQPGDSERALASYQRSVEIAEKLFAAAPESVGAARALSVGLNSLAAFLGGRNKPGDVERALGSLERSLHLAEKLLAANPESAGAARDVAVCLNGLGNLLADRGQPNDAKRALAYYQRSLELKEKLLEANPNSAQAVGDVASAHQNLAMLCGDHGDADGQKKHFRACYDVLHRGITKGMTFEPSQVKLHDKLHALFVK